MDAKTPPVTQLFPDRWSAERAYQHARVLGYTDEVSMVMTDETHAKHFGEQGGGLLAGYVDDAGIGVRVVVLQCHGSLPLRSWMPG